MVTESIDCHREGDWVDKLCMTGLTESIKPLNKIIFLQEKRNKMCIHEADNQEIPENRHLKHITENWTQNKYI